MIGLISTSAKYGNRGAPNSAVEELLHALAHDLSAQGLPTNILSFRDDRLPLPDGRALADDGAPAQRRLAELIDAAPIFVIGLTAYLGHISAASKALFEYIVGANYDAPGEPAPQGPRQAVMIVVGTDPLTTANGVAEAADLRGRLGWTGGEVIGIGNPRKQVIDYSAVSYAVFSQIADMIETAEALASEGAAC